MSHPQTPASALIEVAQGFRDKATWDRWAAQNQHLLGQTATASIVSSAGARGVFDPFLGAIGPDRIEIKGENYRETIYSNGAKSRGRAVLSLLKTIVTQRGNGLDVYASEATSEFSARLRTIFPSFVGSEYLPVRPVGQYTAVMHQDIQQLSFTSASFDLYVSCEVLEHVPFLDQALREAKRVLRPRGVFLGTTPIATHSAVSIVRARMRGDVIEHLMEPEYHVNPVDLEGGSLVFEIPGWDLPTRMRAAGFREAQLYLIMSTTMGIVAPVTGGVLCFIAEV